MKSRIGFSLSLIAAFAAGSFLVRPAAQALESLAVTTCASPLPCIGGVNRKSGEGLVGVSKTGTGVAGVSGPIPTGTQHHTGVLGYSPVYGILGVNSGTAGGAGVYANTLGTNPAQDFAILATATTGGAIFYGQGSAGAAISIDQSANVHTSGKVFTTGSCSTGCSRRRGVDSYAVTAAAATLEDYGEARFAAGSAFVHLDPAFANAVDLRTGYFVLLTPEFASRGLYVAQRLPSGFLVRENPGGPPSSGTFAYRIVAHPFGSAGSPRLPFREIANPPLAQ